MNDGRIGPRRLYRTILLIILSLTYGVVPAAAQSISATKSPNKAAPAALAFKNVTVIDVVDGRLLPEQTVLVVGNRIQEVGPVSRVKTPSGAQVVDARGKYLVPGFWDMHVHVDDGAKLVYPLFVANGVTGIREMAQRGQFPDSFRVWQREVMAGTRVGPRGIGPSADLSQGSRITIRTPDDAKRVIDSLKKAGDPFAKFHGTPNRPDIVFALLSEARRVDLHITGHLPNTLPNTEAVDSGQMGVEHIIINYQCVQRPEKQPLPPDSLEKECTTIAQAYIRNGTWLTPTIAIDYYRYFNRPKVQVFLDYQQYLRTLYRLGVRNFLTGTDCVINAARAEMSASSVCGFPLLQELVLLGESGMAPLDVLRAATLNPAKQLRATDSLGTVASGKLADLVLLDANPLADIHNVMQIRAVVANGRYFDRAALDAMDQQARALTEAFAAQWNGTQRSLP